MQQQEFEKRYGRVKVKCRKLKGEKTHDGEPYKAPFSTIGLWTR